MWSFCVTGVSFRCNIKQRWRKGKQVIAATLVAFIYPVFLSQKHFYSLIFSELITECKIVSYANQCDYGRKMFNQVFQISMAHLCCLNWCDMIEHLLFCWLTLTNRDLLCFKLWKCFPERFWQQLLMHAFFFGTHVNCLLNTCLYLLDRKKKWRRSCPAQCISHMSCSPTSVFTAVQYVDLFIYSLAYFYCCCCHTYL